MKKTKYVKGLLPWVAPVMALGIAMMVRRRRVRALGPAQILRKRLSETWEQMAESASRGTLRLWRQVRARNPFAYS